MKKRLFTLIALISVVSVLALNVEWNSIFRNNQALAVGDLTVVWEDTPLFNESNMAPGDIFTKTVEVTNAASSSRPVGIRGIVTSDTSNMASEMTIEIKEGGTTIYSDTLEQFFLDSQGPEGIPLSDLNPSESTTYDFSVTFNLSAGNEFQNQTIVFDLQIGISIEIPAECQDMDFGGRAPILGTEGDDEIRGTSRTDLIMSFEGNDEIRAGSADDCVISGLGNDDVDTGSGHDFMDLGDGNDEGDAGSGNDVILAGLGDDEIEGGSGNDSIDLSDGNDEADGSSGADAITGGTGNDSIEGGSGNDDIQGDEDNDTIRGGSGNDRLIGGNGTDTTRGDSGTDTCEAETEVSCELNP